ncbi:MAG: hypothetical protein HOE45_03195 [Gammaproteobacteria bacterium]|nr:hypothetical protein [Gammaproteobacteria bacterium]
MDELLISKKSLLLLFLAMLWALVPNVNIYPFLFENGIYINAQIFDHMKIALINTMTREGFPLLNPFYAPEGERIALIYYYGWHFNAAIIKMLTGATGWQTEIGFAWFSSFSILCFLMALSIRLSNKLKAGYWLLLLAFTSPVIEILPHIMGYRWRKWIDYASEVHLFNPVLIQTGWAPQHVFSALTTVVLVFILADAVARKKLPWAHAIMLGLTVAAGFSSSVWVGGVALAIAAPLLLAGLWWLFPQPTKILMPLLTGLCVCILFSLPVLNSILSGPSGSEGFPLSVAPYFHTRFIGANSSFWSQAANLILYFIQFLPLNLGLIYLLGVLALANYIPRQDNESRGLLILSSIVVASYFLMVQFIRSSIFNNDFAWRSVLVPMMLLMVWAAVFLTELPLKKDNWRLFASRLNHYSFFMPPVWVGLTISCLSTIYLWSWPKPHSHRKPDTHTLLLHQDFLKLRDAWQNIEKYTLPTDLVQSNPDSPLNRAVTHWPAPAALALFGNRPTAYTENESVAVFAHSYNKQQKNKQYKAIQALFSQAPSTDSLLYAHDQLKIKALLIEYHDPVWNNRLIFEASGLYKLVEKTETYKIYIAQ